MTPRSRLRRETDDELVTRAAGGEQAACDELYQRYASLVRHVVGDNIRDADEREDATQEAFLRAFSKIGMLREGTSFRPWLLQIARRVAIDSRRKRLRTPVAVIDDENMPDVVSLDPAPAMVAEVRHLAEQLRSGVAMLSSRDAAVLTMVTELGFGISDVAAALDISHTNAKVVLHRARKRLRESLADELDVTAYGAASA
jgi:RNA polymerase sigma-70 factor (ECF subfamily)